VPTNGGLEACDGVDNDCDGLIDDGNPGGGVTCGVNTGECTAGTTTCAFGAIDCVGDVGAAAETCNNLDDDCNGTVDNGFDKLNDPRYCNKYAVSSLPQAIAGCSAGGCTSPAAGRVRQPDGLPPTAASTAARSRARRCATRRQRLRWLVDNADPTLIRPANFCKTAGECAGTTPTCTGATGWDCVYTDPDVETVGGDPALEESALRRQDNDCDGGADEVTRSRAAPAARRHVRYHLPWARAGAPARWCATPPRPACAATSRPLAPRRPTRPATTGTTTATATPTSRTTRVASTACAT
jgi:hypothetical protein